MAFFSSANYHYWNDEPESTFSFLGPCSLCFPFLLSWPHFLHFYCFLTSLEYVITHLSEMHRKRSPIVALHTNKWLFHAFPVSGKMTFPCGHRYGISTRKKLGRASTFLFHFVLLRMLFSQHPELFQKSPSYLSNGVILFPKRLLEASVDICILVMYVVNPCSAGAQIFILKLARPPVPTVSGCQKHECYTIVPFFYPAPSARTD